MNDLLESAVFGTNVQRKQLGLWLQPAAQQRYFSHYLNITGLLAFASEWPRVWREMGWANLVCAPP